MMSPFSRYGLRPSTVLSPYAAVRDAEDKELGFIERLAEFFVVLLMNDLGLNIGCLGVIE